MNRRCLHASFSDRIRASSFELVQRLPRRITSHHFPDQNGTNKVKRIIRGSRIVSDKSYTYRISQEFRRSETMQVAERPQVRRTGRIDAGFIAAVFSDYNSKVRRWTVRNRNRLMYRAPQKRTIFSTNGESHSSGRSVSHKSLHSNRGRPKIPEPYKSGIDVKRIIGKKNNRICRAFTQATRTRRVA